jgi:hypothetical protein
LSPEDSLISLLNLRYQTDENFRRQYALREPTPAERVVFEIRGWLELIKAPIDGLAELGKAVTIAASTAPVEVEETRPTDSNLVGVSDQETAPDYSQVAGVSNWPTVGQTSGEVPANAAQGDQGGIGRQVNWLTVPIETRHPFPSVARQVWELNNPDEDAQATRLHFRRIDLGNNSPLNARIILESLGRKHNQVISGQQHDFWSEPLPGRLITVRFLADNAAPGWGFVLDGMESASHAEAVSTVK